MSKGNQNTGQTEANIHSRLLDLRDQLDLLLRDINKLTAAPRCPPMRAGNL